MSQIDSCPIIVACAADDRYAMPMAVMLRSVIENISDDRQIYIYAIDAGIAELNKKKIASSLGHKLVTFNWIETSISLPNNLPLAKDVLPHVSQAVYYRLLLADILPLEYEKVIYLDSDLIVLQDIDRLWKIEIGENYVMAVQDCSITLVSSPYGLKRYKELNILYDCKYFNSGVMIVNLKKWRSENISIKLFEYLEINRDDIQHHDQDAMNALFAGHWGELEPQWNQTPLIFNYSSWKESPYQEVDYYNAINNPSIVHFASSSKPWNSNQRHPSRYLFYHYLDLTKWSGWRFTIWTRFQQKLVKIIKQSTPFPLKE